MDYFESSQYFYVIYKQANIENSTSLVQLYYNRFNNSDLLDVVQTGNLTLPFSHSLITKMKCEWPGVYSARTRVKSSLDSSVEQFNCYFAIVNGSILRVSFSQSNSPSFQYTSIFEFKGFMNYKTTKFVLSNQFMSCYGKLNQNYTIVNYAKNESTNTFHSVIFTSTEDLDYYLQDNQLWYQNENNDYYFSKYQLQDASLLCPKGLSGVYGLTSVTISVNNGQSLVKLLDILQNSSQGSHAFLYILIVCFVIVVVAFIIGCKYVFRNSPKEPEYGTMMTSEEMMKKKSMIEKRNQEELQKDLNRSFKKVKASGDDTIEEIENMV